MHCQVQVLIFNVRYLLSPVRLSVVCNVRAPYSGTQAVEIFGSISTPLGTLAIH